jgi:hypothetical protein
LRLSYIFFCICVSDESTEDALVEALVGFDIRKVMDVLVTDILAEGDVKTAKILQSVFARLGSQCYTVE